MDARLTAVTLGVTDVARSVSFYEAMGLKTQMQMEDVAFLPLNGLVLCLYRDLAADSGVEGEGRKPGISAIAHNVRERLEVDAVLEEARAAGGTITRPAHDAVWGGRSGYFTDPDGHLWEVAWNPGWPMDSEGRVTL